PPQTSSLFVVGNQGEDIQAGKFGTAVQEGELHREGRAFHDAAERADQLDRGGSRTAGGQQIVAEKHALAFLDGIFVDFERVCAVLQVIGYFCGLGGKLFRLANRDESRVEAIGESGSQNKSAGFDANDQVDFVAVVMRAKLVDQGTKTGLVLQQCGEIVEQDPRLR